MRWVWDGRPFAGRTVVVRCYHGMGDTLQFVRFLPALRAAAARVTLEVQPELFPLLAEAAGADRVIATDAALVSTVAHMLDVPAARIAMIPNSVNLAAMDALTPLDAAPDTPPLLVSVGRIEANKGGDILAAALGSITPSLPTDWRWLHVGEGKGRQQLEATIRAAGIGAHAALCGALPDADLHALLARATLFVHPARYEGSSLVTLEAMAHRLPVVATAVGGIPDKVVPGDTGWLVPPNDARALATAVRDALALPDATRRAMGARGRRRVEAHFSLDHTTDLLLALISDVTA